MTPDTTLIISKTLLQVEYRTLSKVREKFPKNLPKDQGPRVPGFKGSRAANLKPKGGWAC